MESAEEDDNNIDIFFQGLQDFRSKWNALNERCKELETCLSEAKIEKKQLQDKLNLSNHYAKKVEKEKEELASVVQELYRDLKNNPLHQWIETLGKRISSRNDPAQCATVISSPRINENETPFIIDDIDLSSSSSDDENISCSDSSVNKRVTNKSSQVGDEPSTLTSVTGDANDGDHNYNLPKSKTDRSEEESGDRISDQDPGSPSNESSKENSSTINPTLANDKYPVGFEHPSDVVETLLDEENMMSVENLPQRNSLSEEETAINNLHPCVRTSISSQHSPENDVSDDKEREQCSTSNENVNTVGVDKNFSFTNGEVFSEDEDVSCATSQKSSRNYDEFVSCTNQHEHAVLGEESVFSRTVVSPAPQHTPQTGVSSHNAVSADDQSPLRKESTSSADVPVDLPTSAEFPDDREEYCTNSRVTLNDAVYHQNLPCTNESLFQQGVNHEEIFSAEEPSISNEPADSDSFLNRDEGDESANPGQTPEELMSRIFGSISKSPDRSSDVICTTSEPSCIHLNFVSDDDNEAVLNCELKVNLSRIVNMDSKPTVQQSINDMISNLDREELSEQELLKSGKRSYPPGSPLQESKSKRTSPGKLSNLKKDFVWYSDKLKFLKCLICKDDKEFETYAALDMHIISNHPKPYPIYFRCQYGNSDCTRHFKSSKRLYDHVKQRHFGEDLSISVGKLFPGERPWQCSVGSCRKIFAISKHLRWHYRQMHPTHREATEPETKKFVSKVRRKTVRKSVNNGLIGECVICLNENVFCDKFKTYHELDDHLYRNHPNPYPFYFKCPFCPRHFKGLTWLNNHTTTHHTNSEDFSAND